MMHRKTVKTWLVLVVAAVFCLTAPMGVFAKGFGMKGPGPGKGIGRLLQSLDLTEEQQTEIEAIVSESRAAIEPLREHIDALGVPEAVFAEALDVTQAAALQESAGELKSQIGAIRAASMLDISQVLTAEQRALVLEKIKERQERRQKLHEMMEGSGGDE